MLREISLLCLAAGVCALDTTAAWQLMISQPLVCGTLAGFLVGFPDAGVFIGVVLQLLWSGSMPVGALPMPDAPVGTISGVWLAAILLGSGQAVSTSFSQLAGLLAAMCIALVGRWTIVWERELSSRLFQRIRARFSSGKTVNPDVTQALTLTVSFLRGALLCLIAVGVLYAIALALVAAGNVVEIDYKLVVLVVQGLAIGVLIPVFARRAKGRLPAFAGGVALALVVRNLIG